MTAARYVMASEHCEQAATATPCPYTGGPLARTRTQRPAADHCCSHTDGLVVEGPSLNMAKYVDT